jgi:hypothetical protein
MACIPNRAGLSSDGDGIAFLAEGEDMGYCEYGKGREESSGHQ